VKILTNAQKLPRTQMGNKKLKSKYIETEQPSSGHKDGEKNVYCIFNSSKNRTQKTKMGSSYRRGNTLDNTLPYKYFLFL